jgi:hypothetical protein
MNGAGGQHRAGTADNARSNHRERDLPSQKLEWASLHGHFLRTTQVFRLFSREILCVFDESTIKAHLFSH